MSLLLSEATEREGLAQDQHRYRGKVLRADKYRGELQCLRFSFVKYLRQLFLFQLTSSDSRSKFICAKCDRKITEFSVFRHELIQNEAILQQFTKSEEESEKLFELEAIIVKTELIDEDYVEMPESFMDTAEESEAEETKEPSEEESEAGSDNQEDDENSDNDDEENEEEEENEDEDEEEEQEVQTFACHVCSKEFSRKHTMVSLINVCENSFGINYNYNYSNSM